MRTLIVKVICNSTPLIALSSINKLQLLHNLFGEIIIPEKVYSEVVIAGSGKYGSVDVKACPWIRVAKTSNYSLKNILMQLLDEGEAEVIALADEQKAALVIIDERLARKCASVAGFNLIGTLGIIAKSKVQGYIPEARGLIATMLEKGIWFNNALVNRILIELGEEPL
jgi:uncharacterized protein